MKEFNFNSQITTSREQSKRLLALGLKKETADMVWLDQALTEDYEDWRAITIYKDWEEWQKDGIPAWSLHRLIEMMPESLYHNRLVCFLFIKTSVYVEYRRSSSGESQTIVEQFKKSNLWENLIDCIEWLIKEGYFNKEYLENEMEEKA